MEAFGFFYIIAFFISCNLSIVSAIFPSVEITSAFVDIFIFTLCTPVLLLSILGKLKPRKVFILLPLVYFFSLACGTAVAILLAFKIGIENIPEITTAAFFTSHLPWFPIFRWCFILVGEAFAIYGLTTIVARRKKLKAERDAKAETESEVEVSFEN